MGESADPSEVYRIILESGSLGASDVEIADVLGRSVEQVRPVRQMLRRRGDIFMGTRGERNGWFRTRSTWVTERRTGQDRRESGG